MTLEYEEIMSDEPVRPWNDQKSDLKADDTKKKEYNEPVDCDGSALGGCLVVGLVEILAFVAIAIMVCLFSSCSKTEYVPVETVKTEYVTKTDSVISHDTIIQNKTTIVRQVDSAYMAQLGIQMAGKEKAWLVDRSSLEKKIAQLQTVKSDTVIKTLYKEKPVTVEVEKKVAVTPVWAKVLLWILFVLSLIMAVILFGGKIYRKILTILIKHSI